MRARWVLLVFLAVGCKKGQPTDQHTGSAVGSAAAGSGSAGSAAPAPSAWTLDSQPVALTCGGDALKLPPPAAASPKPDRPLPHAGAFPACQDQASIAAVCDCLAKSVKSWDESLSAQVECKPQAPEHPDAQLVEVSSKPADDSTAGGVSYVFVAKHGATWSPVASIEDAPDVDLSVTPQATHTATIDAVETKPIASGNLYWIASHNDATDKDTGDTDHEGEAHGTVCVVPTSGAPFCTKPLTLGAWTYAYTPSKESCAITKVATYSAKIDATSVTLKLEHGSDDAGNVGRYTF